MKTAVLFYGFFRTFNECYSSVMSDIIEPLDADVYFYSYRTFFTPKSIEEQERYSESSINDDLLDINKIQFQLKNRVKDFVIEDYNPGLYHRLVQRLNMPEKNIVNQYHWRIFSLMHGINKTINLFSHKKVSDYDLVILMRPDAISLRKIEPSLLDLNQLSCPYPEGYVTQNLSGPAGYPDYFCDQSMAASQDIILRMSHLFSTTIDLVKNGHVLCSEAILGLYCKKHNIPFGPSNFHFHKLVREFSL
jgi:hypothetical protein